MNINSFEIRSYGWQELAILYAPDLTPESAAKRLSTWVQINPTLLTTLEASGWRKGQRVLTPRQVGVIVDFLGEP